jgi:hypothetical protein
MFFMPRFLHFDSTIIVLKRGNTSLNKEGLQFSDTGDTLYYGSLLAGNLRFSSLQPLSLEHPVATAIAPTTLFLISFVCQLLPPSQS